MKPKYSIVIPVYKRIFGFDEALGSALKVEGCTEVIVVDDNSDHNEFLEICNSFGDERIKYFKNEANIGLFGNWNKGIDLSTGEFVSILCSDDLIEPDAYTLFLKAYESNPSIDVFFGSFSTFVESPADAITHRSFPAGKTDPAFLMKDAVDNGPGFSVLSIIRKTTVQKLPFVARPHSGNDWLWIYGNAAALNLHAIDKPINFWRRHPDQDASKSQSITTDCWPLMFMLVEKQLHEQKNPVSYQALKRAKGVVLTWLLNDFNARVSYYPRLRGEEGKSNYFLQNALQLIDGDWLLKGLLRAKTGSWFFYNIARLVRKTGLYPAS